MLISMDIYLFYSYYTSTGFTWTVATYLEVEASDEAFEGPCFARTLRLEPQIQMQTLMLL